MVNLLRTVPKAPDLSAYDTLFVGYPNWWGTMPMALFTFFEANDLKGKTGGRYSDSRFLYPASGSHDFNAALASSSVS